MSEKKGKLKHSIYIRKADLENVANYVWDPTVIDWKDLIEDYIHIAKKRCNRKLSMFKLQLSIISDILLVNNTIKGYINLVESPDLRIEQFPGIVTDASNVDYWEKQIISFKIILVALKDIGDGIAWRLFKHDRPLIYNMCINNQEAGPLTISQGFLTELQSIGDFTSDNDVEMFVYHGITNFLNVGDISVKYNNGEINLIEVKSKKNPRGESWKNRLAKQEERRENISNLANSGHGKAQDINIKIEIVSGKPKTILNKLGTLLKTAKNKPYLSKQFYSYLTICVINFDHVKDDDSWKNKVDNAKRSIKKQKEDIILTVTSTESKLFSVNRAPWSIFPFDAEIVSNILMGKFILVYYFNLSEFMRMIDKAGWKVSNLIRSPSDLDKNSGLFFLSKENFKINFPPLLASRAIYEGLSLDSIIVEFEDFYAKGLQYDKAYFHGYEKEYYLWE